MTRKCDFVYNPEQKIMILFVFVVIVGFVSMARSNTQFFPNLPVGEYRVIFDTISSCKNSKDHKIHFNLYLSKKSLKTTELKGNITGSTDFDDSLSFNLNFASWSSLGGWKENSAVIQTPDACTNVKKLLGRSWYSLVKSFGFPSGNCPITKGTYISTGFDLTDFQNFSYPKVFFYGKYNVLYELKKKNTGTSISCIKVQINVLRPWEVSP